MRGLNKMSRRTLSSKLVLHRLLYFRHLWMLSEMWVACVFLKLVRRSNAELWAIGSWKKVRNDLANELKDSCDIEGWSIYHFTAGHVRVC